MLSDELRSLERYMQQVKTREIEMTETGLERFLRTLRACRKEAEAMERRSHIAQELTEENLTQNVTLFPLHPPSIRRLIHPIPDPDQGGAA